MAPRLSENPIVEVAPLGMSAFTTKSSPFHENFEVRGGGAPLIFKDANATDRSPKSLFR